MVPGKEIIPELGCEAMGFLGLKDGQVWDFYIIPGL